MASKRKKRALLKTNSLAERFAFTMIVFLIIISFSVVALVVSSTPLN